MTENEATFDEGKVLALPVMGLAVTGELQAFAQDETMIVDLEGFEGPLDVLLNHGAYAEGRSDVDLDSGAGGSVHYFY